jgi:hypothetical protein
MQKRQVCDTNFFVGELDLHEGKKADAARPFRQATDGFPDYLIFYERTKAELKVLNAP